MPTLKVCSVSGLYRKKEVNNFVGAFCDVVVKALRYYSEDPRIDPRWSHWGFFPWHPGSTQPLKMSTRILLGVKTAGALG
jgi:hypothetical protein